MKYGKYQIHAAPSKLHYIFYSHGPKGRVAKKVVYEEHVEGSGIFNLSFGDMDENDDIDDIVVTDNGDREKVLATVALTAVEFVNKYPNCWIFISGSTRARTRLYRMGISKHLEELENNFYIFGYRRRKWLPFEKNVNYEYFLIGSKKS